MSVIALVAALLASYLVGSLSFAVIISRAMGLADPRSYGSKNPGATNVLRSGNRAAAVLTLAFDALKGFVPVLLVLAFGPPPRAARALAAFSGVGPALVAVLVATGLVNGWLLVGWGPLAALAGSPYVRLLAIKLVLFAGMLALAALNRLRLTAAVAREAEAALPALRASLAIETALGLAVLAVVAALGVTAPPTSF